MAEENKSKEEYFKKLQDEKLQTYERFLDKTLKLYDKHQKSSSRTQVLSTVGGFLALVITLGIGGAGILADAYMTNQDRDDQTMRHASQRKMQIIADVSNAMTRMRELKDVSVIACSIPLSAEGKIKHLQERAKKGFDLLTAVRPVSHLFNKEFRDLYMNFLAWEESIRDYCDKNAPTEEEWRNKQKEIEDQMILAPITSFYDI